MASVVYTTWIILLQENEAKDRELAEAHQKLKEKVGSMKSANFVT